jgi:competence ComEA-like helix-hairpin-helix protein
MATTPLRPYIREIELLIDQGHIDEAIAHCRHILSIFPKNLAAYRLLGKAFLESQRFGDASDLFQRVLSAVPDDFVSHVGMSIIREDEGNQDAAIWHMERAFEVQPYNSAIQDELRRLYGRRDGIEPPKVRLTRGALARMYARGDLYQQAMGELRSALLEDPQRTDLQVLLARMYYLSGQKVEAVEVSSKLLKKLPNCLEANRIIAAILPETERKDEAPAYQNRVAALDPYLAQASPKAVDVDEVPEQTVVVGRLDTSLVKSPSEPGQPTWASSLGVSIEPFGAPKDSLPDWLTQTEEEEPEKPSTQAAEGGEISEGESIPVYPEIQEDESSVDEGELPDWMKEAGWEVPAEGAGDTPEHLEAGAEAKSFEDDQPQGDIPDWLKEMAPPGTLPDEDAQEIEDGDDLFPWMEEEGEKEEEGAPAGIQEDETGEWTPGGNGDERQVEELPEFELPDWLADIETSSKPASEEVPDWLVDSTTSEEKSEAKGFELPEWLAGVQPSEGVSEKEQGIEDVQPDVPVGKIEAMDEGAELEAEIEATLQTEDDDELPDWLSEMEKPVEPGEEAPEEAELEAELEAEFEAALQAEGDDDELPDWLREMEKPVEPGEEAPEEAELEAELEAVLEATLQSEDDDELPDWLREMEKPAETGEEAPEEAELEAELEATLQTEDDDELPDWLKEMEKPVEPGDEAPEEAELGAELEAELEAEFEAALQAEGDDEELPDWLSEMEKPVEPVDESKDLAPWEAELERERPGEELPDWLGDVGAAEEIIEEQLAYVEPLSDLARDDTALEADEIPWFEEAQAEEEPLEEEAVETAEAAVGTTELELSDTQPVKVPVDTSQPIEDIGEEEGVEEVLHAFEEEAPSAELVDDDAAMAWLEGLAAKHGVPEEELITKVEDRSETLPDWIAEEKPAGEPAAVEKDEETVEAGLPDPVEEELAVEAVEEELSVETEEEKLTAEAVEEDASGLEAPFSAEQLEPAAEEEADEEAPSIDLPDWLVDITTEGETAEQAEAVSEVEALEVEAVEPETSQPARIESVPVSQAEDLEPLTGLDYEDDDEAMAWLEGLAAKHGVPEEELITSPEERPLETPEWIQEIQEEEVQLSEDLEAEAEGQTEVDKLSDWQIEDEPAVPDQELEIEEVQLEVEEPVQEEILPAEETPIKVMPGEEEQVEAAGEEIPAWLQEMVKEEEEETGVPEWLDEIEEEVLSEEAEELEKPAEIPDWLIEAEKTLLFDREPEIDDEAHLAEAQIIQFSPEEPGEEEFPAEEAVLTEAREVAPEESDSAELPGWLKDLEEEEAEGEEVPWEPAQAVEEDALTAVMPEQKPVPILDINQASLIELEETPGIGFRLAQRIVEHRQTKGPFQKLEDLAQVPGITQELILELSDRLYLTAPPEETAELVEEKRPEGAGPEWNLLNEARAAFKESSQTGIEQYNELVRQDLLLEEVAGDLRAHLQADPENYQAWITLGDALNRMDQTKEALEAYIKAEQLLR